MENKPVTNEHVSKALSLFKTEDDLTVDVVFRKNLQDLLTKQWNRPEAPAGKRYVRGAWEYFNEHECFNIDNFLIMNNAIKNRIGHKLPMAVREYTKRIWDAAVRSTLVHYAQVEANK